MNSYQDDDLYLAEQKRLSMAAAVNAAESIQAGHPFSLLLAEDDDHRAAALETVVQTIAAPTIRIARATNPLRAPLTLERLLIQVVPDAAGILDLGPAAIVGHIAERHGAETAVLLVIERAETLHPELLHFLGQASDFFTDVSPTLQILFVGRPAFQQLLAHPESGFDRRTILLEEEDSPDEPEQVASSPSSKPAVSPYLLLSPSSAPSAPPSHSAAPPPPPQTGSFAGDFAAMWRENVFNRLIIVLGPLIALAAIATGITVAVSPPHEPVQPEPVATLADRPAPGQANPLVPEPRQPREEATAELRREFEAYLAASGKNLDRMPESQARAAYDEFITWRARSTGRPQASP